MWEKLEQKDFGRILSQTIARLRREQGLTQGALGVIFCEPLSPID